MELSLERMKSTDWPAVQVIYCEGIATGNATFETETPEWEEWNHHHLQVCRLVARIGDRIVGWAALSPVSSRPVYAGVTWASVYVAASAQGRGIGTRLLQALIAESEQAGIWTLQAGIFPENKASIRLHKACGYRIVGRRERLGLLHGVWRDVILMERRSNVTGT